MFDMFFYFTIFLFGLIIGSFLNCVIYRLETGNSFLKGRSYCPHCKHTLALQDLIPVLSFLLLRGKCRYCQKPISWQYPLVELTTGILFVFTLIYFFLKTSILVNSAMTELISIYYLVIGCFLIIIFVYDLKHYIIPDKIIYPAIAIAFIYNLLRSDLLGRSDLFVSALGAGAFFLVIVLISRGKWMGVGDVKLAFLMGLILGFPNILVALFLAFFIGAAIGLGLIAAGKKRLSSEIPFGPFLVSATFISIFFGERIINFYLNLILLK